MPITDLDFQVRAVMTSVTGLPEDVTVNTFAFRFDNGGADPQSADFDALHGHVGDFYRIGAVPNDQVGTYIGTSVDRGATHLIQTVSALTGGSPIHETSWLGPVAAGGASNLPTEVAGCLSFHADLVGIPEQVGGERPRANRRGRIYVGPLRNHAVDGAQAHPVLSTSFRLAMSSNAVDLADNAAADNWVWCVWSRESAEFYPVVGGWTDDAPDTQRRRGQDVAQRSTWGPVGP